MVGRGKEMTVHMQYSIDDNWVLKCLNKNEGEKFFGGDVFELIH